MSDCTCEPSVPPEVDDPWAPGDTFTCQRCGKSASIPRAARMGEPLHPAFFPAHSPPPLPPTSTTSSGPTLDEVLAAFGRLDFVVWVERTDDGFKVQALELTGDNNVGVGTRFFKAKNGATVLEALRRIAHYHTELARMFEARQVERHGERADDCAERADALVARVRGLLEERAEAEAATWWARTWACALRFRELHPDATSCTTLQRRAPRQTQVRPYGSTLTEHQRWRVHKHEKHAWERLEWLVREEYDRG